MSFEIHIINDFSAELEIAIRPQVYMQFGMSQISGTINCSEVFGCLAGGISFMTLFFAADKKSWHKSSQN